MFKVIVVDNSVKEVNNLIELLTQFCPQIDVVNYATNFDDGIKLIKKIKPELIFINPKVSTKSCFAFLEKQKASDFETVFVSQDEVHSIKALRFGVTDYLLKPVKHQELQQAVTIAIQKILQKRANQHKELLLNNVKNSHSIKSQKFAIPTIEGLVFVKIDDIIRFEANGTYTNIHTVKKEKIVASKNVKEFEDILPKTHFFRIHNSHLVNINRLAKYSKGRGGTITMEDGTQIEVASRRKNDFLEIFNQY